MKLQEKIQGAINTFVIDAKQNVESAKEQVTSAYTEVVAATKEELELQKVAFATYKERIAALTSKGFNKDAIVEDVKGEVAFFGNEIKTSVDRNISRFKNIFAPKAEEVKEAVEAVTEEKVEAAG